MIGVSWPTAQSMLRKLRRAMGDRDRSCRLTGLAEADDALVGARRAGKRGRGAEGKQPVLFAVERKGGRAGFPAAQVVEGVNHEQVGAFSRRLGDGLRVRSDAFRGLTAMARDHAHEPRPTPPDKADEWLPLVHLVISNFKRFLIGAFHGGLREAPAGVPRRVRLPLQPPVLGGAVPGPPGRGRRHPHARPAQAEAGLEVCQGIEFRMAVGAG